MTVAARTTANRRIASAIWLSTVVGVATILTATAGIHWSLLAQAIAVAGAGTGILVWWGLPGVGWWLGLTILGAAAILQLTDAGPRVAYQHLVLPWAVDTGPRSVAALILIVQAACVAFFWGRRAHHAWRFLTNTFGRWRLAALTVAVILTSAALSRDVGFYFQELLVAPTLQIIALGSLIATLVTLPAEIRGTIANTIRRWLEPTDEPPSTGRVDALIAGTALTVVLVCAFLALTIYQRHPHVPDEVAYLFQARYFAAGWLTMPAPPMPEAFSLDLMTYEATRWYSPTPPSWPAVLAIGVFLGVPWLVNPILAGLCVLLAYVLVWNVYDRATARLVLLLLATSPWFLFVSMTYMTHTLSLTCALGAALATWHLRQGATLWWGIAGGLALAILGMNRPLEGLIVSALLGLWVLGGQARSWRIRAAGLGALGATAMAGGSLIFPYNRSLTGDPTTFPIMAYADALGGPGSNSLGFGPNRGLDFFGGLDPFPGHSPLDAIINTSLNLFSSNVELFGWMTGSFWFIGILLLLGPIRRQDYWFLLAALAVIGAHGLYWFSGGPDFGARYWFLIILPVVVLSARGIQVLAVRMAPGEYAPTGSFPMLLAVSLVAIATSVFLPWRAVDKYIHYRGMRPDVRRLAEEHGFGRSVVLVRGARHPDYASAAVYNPLDLQAPEPIYVWDRGAAMYDDLIDVYGDRTLWIVNGPTLSDSGYTVVDGPITDIRSLRSPGLP